MKTKKDNPGVYIPPPLLYVTIFLISVLVEKYISLSKSFFQKPIAQNLAILFIFLGAMFLLPALLRFIKSKNTLVTFKPATSLQSTGIYAFTRNPMYAGLLCIYTGIAFLEGNWWTFILIPGVLLVVTYLVIRKEEAYLERAFGQEYLEYRKRVRRWM